MNDKKRFLSTIVQKINDEMDVDKTIVSCHFPWNYILICTEHWNIMDIGIRLNRLKCGLQSLNLNPCRGGKIIYHGQGVDMTDIIYRNHRPRNWVFEYKS